jgi:O-methyltransferase involved in polyketide biosynthesis
MRPDQPSRTALMVGIHRAAHQALDTPPVLADPLALHVLPPRDLPLLARFFVSRAARRMARAGEP